MKKTVLVKIGGSTIDTPGLLTGFANAVKSLAHEAFVVVVHGGGKDIARQLGLLKKEFTFVEGMRVTDEETMKHVQMVLSGDVNKRIVSTFLSCDVFSLGLSGVDGNLICAKKMLVSGKDIGCVGEVECVDTRLIEMCRVSGCVPVVSPVSRGVGGEVYNVNADLAASEVAIALKADHCIFISDVDGVLNSSKEVINSIRTTEIETMITEGIATGGMIPKLRSAADAIARGVRRVHICGWHGENTLVQELFETSASGTVIY